MTITQKVLSVAETADLCKVGRSTVGYWIRSKKIAANQVGRSYVIPAEELHYFLKSAGRSIPPELIRIVSENPFFRKIKNCWEFWSETKKIRFVINALSLQISIVNDLRLMRENVPKNHVNIVNTFCKPIIRRFN